MVKYRFTLNVDVTKTPKSIKIKIRPDELARIIEGVAKVLQNNNTLEFVFLPAKENPERWQAIVREVNP
ncbi:MAG: hypothetical protein K9W43_14335 [Candidatus Thorarchaeota archaeon]|nr:hypothetical protein [Candidatus Thorarchaeota archaeon]